MMEQVGIRGRGSDSVCSQDSVQILEGTGEDRQGKNGFNASSKQPVSSRTRSRQVSKTGGDRETGQQGAEPELLVPRRRMRRTPMKIIGKKRAANDEIIERKDRMTHPSKLESRKDPEFAMKLYESAAIAAEMSEKYATAQQTILQLKEDLSQVKQSATCTVVDEQKKQLAWVQYYKTKAKLRKEQLRVAEEALQEATAVREKVQVYEQRQQLDQKEHALLQKQMALDREETLLHFHDPQTLHVVGVDQLQNDRQDKAYYQNMYAIYKGRTEAQDAVLQTTNRELRQLEEEQLRKVDLVTRNQELMREKRILLKSLDKSEAETDLLASKLRVMEKKLAKRRKSTEIPVNKVQLDHLKKLPVLRRKVKLLEEKVQKSQTEKRVMQAKHEDQIVSLKKETTRLEKQLRDLRVKARSGRSTSDETDDTLSNPDSVAYRNKLAYFQDEEPEEVISESETSKQEESMFMSEEADHEETEKENVHVQQAFFGKRGSGMKLAKTKSRLPRQPKSNTKKVLQKARSQSRLRNRTQILAQLR